MPENTPPPSKTAPSGWLKVAGAVALVTAIVGIVLTAFALPNVKSEPTDIPVAVAGPGPALDQLSTRLERAQPGAFEVTTVADAGEARELIENREVYGAVLAPGADGPKPKVLTATAASPTVAQTLTGLAGGLGGPAGAATVEDVRPLPADDPRGVGLSSAALPLVMGGMIGTILLTTVLTGTSRRAIGALVLPIVAGLTLAAILHYGFGSLDGNYLLESGAIALGIAAMIWTLLGLRTLFGNAGLGLGAAVLMLLGNPLSGMTSAPEMLPAGWGTLGQLLPPGAGGTLLRTTAYFDGAGAAGPVAVLVGWLVLGVALFGIGALRDRRRTMPAGEPEPTSGPAPVPTSA